MPNPTINFRMSPEQLARGLWIIQQIQPDYHPTSHHQIVKLLYIDYLDKMDIYRTTDVPTSVINEINNLLTKQKKVLYPKDISLSNLPKPNKISKPKYKEQPKLDNAIKLQEAKNFNVPVPEDFLNTESSSKISTVTDFSPPKDWMDD